ncbi:MAG: M48 family metallopeptidase [bacterium]
MKNSYKKNIFSIMSIFITTVFIILSFSMPLFAFSSIEEEISINNWIEMDKNYDIYTFPDDDKAVQILNNLQESITHPEFKGEEFKIFYVDHDMINAYYIGNGDIMLFKGLLQELNTEEELAALIAHEIGHGVGNDLEDEVKNNLGVNVVSSVFNYFTEKEFEVMFNTFNNIIKRGYSREQERDADVFAANLMLKSGYDPTGLIDLMNVLKNGNHDIKLLEFTKTHPLPDSRIDYINNYIAENRSEIVEIEPVELELSNTFVHLYFPNKWNLAKSKSAKNLINFEFENDKIAGEILFENLNDKTFLETAKKQFLYSKITFEEEGYLTEDEYFIRDNLEIYRLKCSGKEEVTQYFISEKEKKKVLKLKFVDINDSNSEPISRKIIQNIVDSIEYK